MVKLGRAKKYWFLMLNLPMKTLVELVISQLVQIESGQLLHPPIRIKHG